MEKRPPRQSKVVSEPNSIKHPIAPRANAGRRRKAQRSAAPGICSRTRVLHSWSKSRCDSVSSSRKTGTDRRLGPRLEFPPSSVLPDFLGIPMHSIQKQDDARTEPHRRAAGGQTPVRAPGGAAVRRACLPKAVSPSSCRQDPGSSQYPGRAASEPACERVLIRAAPLAPQSASRFPEGRKREAMYKRWQQHSENPAEARPHRHANGTTLTRYQLQCQKRLIDVMLALLIDKAFRNCHLN